MTGTDRYAATERQALRFFGAELFGGDGAPNFDESRSYPRDIHASTQGVLVFAYAGEFEFARRPAVGLRGTVGRRRPGSTTGRSGCTPAV